MRIIDKKPYIFPTNQLFIKYKILKVPELVLEQNIVILLSFLNGTLPIALSSLFQLNGPLSTRSPEHFVVPFTRSNFRMFSISLSAPRAWNTVIHTECNNIDEVPRSKSILKKKVRAVLLEKYK